MVLCSLLGRVYVHSQSIKNQLACASHYLADRHVRAPYLYKTKIQRKSLRQADLFNRLRCLSYSLRCMEKFSAFQRANDSRYRDLFCAKKRAIRGLIVWASTENAGIWASIHSPTPIAGLGKSRDSIYRTKTGDLRFRSPEPDGRLIWFPHLHNTYLEILLRYGLVGFFLFISALLASLLRLKRSISDQHDPRTLNALVFTGMGIVFFATCGLAGFQIMQEEWRAPFSLLFALAFAGRFRIRAESPEPASTSAIR